MCSCVLVCVSFKDEILLRGKNVKPGKNSVFLKNGKKVILVENRKFSRSRMTKWTSLLYSSREV